MEPLDDWGEGSVQLIELPTDDEIHDNIVAMWTPKQAATAGTSLRLRYRLYWSADEPHPTRSRAASPRGWVAAASLVIRAPRACANS